MNKTGILVKWAIDMTSKHSVVISDNLFGGKNNTLFRRQSVAYLKAMGITVWPMPDGKHILSKTKNVRAKSDGKVMAGILAYEIPEGPRVLTLPVYRVKDYNYL